MRPLFLLATFLSFSVAHGGNIQCEHNDQVFHCVKYLENYDGDTIKFNIPKVHPLLGNKINVRVRGVDTAEIRTNDKCKKSAAALAKKKVASILKGADRIDLKNVERGKYFRIVAEVIADGQSLTELLLKNNLASAYGGGKKKAVNWCDRLPASSR